MRLSIITTFAALLVCSAAENLLYSSSLNTCQDNSGFTARLFNFVFTRNNNTAFVNIVAVSSIVGNVVFDVVISAYGYQVTRRIIDPCAANSGLAGMCPMRAGNLLLPFNIQVSEEAASQIPNITYSFPDLDAKVKVLINKTDGDAAGQTAACVEAVISNGKTVNLLGVKWASAGVAILALLSSALVSGLGHTNAASHLAAAAASLFGYFQALSMIGMTGVRLPPIVQAWTQNFQWSMGIIKVNFMQDIFTWYQRATGGTPTTLFDTLTTTSVQVEKRGILSQSSERLLPALNLFSRSDAMAARAADAAAPPGFGGGLSRRANLQTGSGSYVVYGIQRVAFASGIESSNLFMTGLTFFCIFLVVAALLVGLFRILCGLWAKDKFLDFRNGWKTTLKGILFRICLIQLPVLSVLGLWELSMRDSPAEVALATISFISVVCLLAYAAFKIIAIARRSIILHRNPAYILFSDPQMLNKWGFLYVQFRASAYYFIVPILVYTVVKTMFIALAQRNGIVQAIALLLLEAAAVITTSVLRPWMDKSTNSFNIGIHAINFVNSCFLLMFTNIFDQPPLVTGVIGVVLWILNAVFALVLILVLIITTIVIFTQKNPDSRYQYMLDDRTSFVKSQTQLDTTAELNALAMTARGGPKGLDLLDDDDSDESVRRGRHSRHTSGLPSAPEMAAPSPYQGSHGSSAGNPRHSVDRSSSLVQMRNQPIQPFSEMSESMSLQPHQVHHGGATRINRKQNTVSPWQRGAGYEM